MNMFKWSKHRFDASDYAYTNDESHIDVWFRTLWQYGCSKKRAYMVYLKHENCEESPFSVLVFGRRKDAQKMFRILCGMVEKGMGATEVRHWFLDVDYKTMGVISKRSTISLCDLLDTEYTHAYKEHAKKFNREYYD